MDEQRISLLTEHVPLFQFREFVPTSIVERITTIATKSTDAAMLDRDLLAAQAELRNLLQNADTNTTQSQPFTVSQTTEQMLGFSTHIEATRVASNTLNPDYTEAVKEDVLNAIKQLIHAAAAIQDQLKLNRNLGDPAKLTSRYNMRASICDAVNAKMSELLTYPILRANGVNSTDTWIPLHSLKEKSEDEILRYIIRSVQVDDYLNGAINTILFSFLRGAHLELDFSTIANDNNSLFVNGEQLFQEIETAGCRDALGATMAQYLRMTINGRSVEAYDQSFRQAHFTAAAYLKQYYLQHPFKNTPSTLNSSVPSIRQVADTESTQTSTRVTITQTTTEPTSPPALTVDFRHPTETPPAQTPPAPEEPTDQQSKIKPINIS